MKATVAILAAVLMLLAGFAWYASSQAPVTVGGGAVRVGGMEQYSDFMQRVNGVLYAQVSTDVFGAAANPWADGYFTAFTAGTLTISSMANAAVTIQVENATANAVTDLLILEHLTTGTPAAGIGDGISFKIEDAGGSEEQASIDVALTDVTNGTEDADIVFSQNINGAITETLRLDADGGADFKDISIINVGDIALDSITSDGTTITIGGTPSITLTDDTSIVVTLGSDAGDDFIIDTTGLVYEGDNNYVGIGTAAPLRTLDIAGNQRLLAGQLDNLHLDFETTETRQVNLLKARVQVDGNMSTGASLPDGGTVTGNVNIFDIEADVGAGGLISGAKFTGLSISIDGHADDQSDASIYGIELATNNVGSPANENALRIYNNWNRAVYVSGGTFTSIIDMADATAYTNAIAYKGGVNVKTSTGLVEHEYTAGTLEFRLDSAAYLGQFTWHNAATRLGRFYHYGDNLVLANEVQGGEFHLYGTPSGGSATRYVTLASTGNVGIGTTGPDQNLHVEEDNAATATPVVLQRLSITSTGTPAAGLGPSLEFEVETAAGAPGNQEVVAAIDGIAIDVTSTSEDGALVFKLMTNGAAVAQQFRIESDGGIFAYNLLQQTAAGLVVEYDTTSKEIYAETSTRRMKQWIQESRLDTSSLFELDTKQWIDKESGRPGYGLIAEEVAEVLPELVVYDAGGEPLGIQQTKVIYALFDEVKRLRAEVNALKAN